MANEADAEVLGRQVDRQRRRRTLLGAAAALVVMGGLTAWLWWDGRGFDPGDTIAVTAEVVACGSIRISAGGEDWQSEDQHIRSAAEEATESGTLRRITTDQARYTADTDGLAVAMQRIRPDYFWEAGCGLAPSA